MHRRKLSVGLVDADLQTMSCVQSTVWMYSAQYSCHDHIIWCTCSDQGIGAQLLIKGIAQSADAGPGGWVGLKRKLLHLDVDGSGAINAEGEPMPIVLMYAIGLAQQYFCTYCYENILHPVCIVIIQIACC